MPWNTPLSVQVKVRMNAYKKATKVKYGLDNLNFGNFNRQSRIKTFKK
jgi:hypothetical protein